MREEQFFYLITGGCGFIGSHIVDRLIAGGQRVLVVDDLSTGKLENLNEAAIFHQGDAADRQFMSQIFEQYPIKYLIHQASRINTNALLEDPEYDVRCSVGSVLVLADLCVQHKVRKLVFASSVAVYGRPVNIPAAEDDITIPVYSYGIAKLCAENYLRYYHENYGLDYQILRYCNVFGPRQPIYGEVGVIAIFTEKIVNGEPLTIFGDGLHERDYIYISDVVDFTLLSIGIDESSIFNVGRGEPVTVQTLYRIYKGYNLSGSELIIKPERYGEIGKFYSDIAKATATGWKPAVGIQEGIRKTISHFRASQENR